MQTEKKPIVKDGFLLGVEPPIPVGSTLWFQWLASAKKFSFKRSKGGYIAQCEIRRNKPYWYAYKRQEGKLHKAYLGKTEEITLEKLQQVGLFFAGEVQAKPLPPVFTPGEAYPLESRIDSSFLPLAKVTVPVLPRQMVSRPRLLQKVNTALTILYAPSGFGKSTTLNDWKKTCGYPVAWLSLDKHDNSPPYFWRSVISSFQTIDSGFGKNLRAYLSSVTSTQPAEVIHSLLLDLLEAQTLFPRLGLVLDDFHHLSHSGIYDAIQTLLEHLPAHFHLVISGHTRPPLSLGHLRAQGLLTELDVNDLRFTLPEAIHYLQQYPQEPPLAYADLEKLARHTEGWAVGLTLTALALNKQEDQRQFIDTFSGAHIYMREYFMETVLQRTKPEVQSFLLKTAILKNLTGGLCNAITGQTNGDEMLEYLWHKNLFIVRLEKKGWYRYHDLFAEMLHSQTEARYPQEISQLHQRAAQWYREQYAPADAIYHLLSVEAWDEAASLIEEMALRELEQYGEDSRLLRWVQDIPESVVQKHKNLLFMYMRLANNAISQHKTEKFIRHIERNISGKPASQQTQDEKDVLVEIEAIQRTWAQGVAFVPPDRSGNEYDARWSLLNRLYLLKPAYSQCQERAEEPIFTLLREAQAQNNLFVTLMAGGVLAKRFVLSGQLKRAEKICNQVLDTALAQRGQLPETASIALGVLSQLHIERNEMELANKYLAQASKVDPNPTSTNMPIQFAILRAKIQMALHQKEESLATIKTAQQLNAKRPSGVWSQEDLLAHEILLHLHMNNLPAAERLLAEIPAGTEHTFLQQLQAELYLKKNQFAEAEETLWRAIEKFPSLVMLEPLLEARVLLSLALFRQNTVNQAVQVMIGALRLSAPEHFIRPFLRWGEACGPILLLAEEAQGLGRESQAFIQKILKSLAAQGEPCKPPKAAMDKLIASASISAREREVLFLLAEGYSNREISHHLSVSESTVKTHLGNVYAKLNVNSRVQAVSQAKQLQIIP